jgi:hypothetical protein
MTWPAALYVVGFAVLVSESAGLWTAVTVAVASLDVTWLPP